MSDSATDEQFLRRALELAHQAIGLASPNPNVGAVITDSKGEVAGTGFHTYAGVKHAEVLAMEQAGERARGGTLYINLEPCSHQGRTPPCADAVIAAGIRRVVAAMEDPNPVVAGRGFEKLRAAGIQVETGGLADEAHRLNESFTRYIRSKTPFVTLKSAMTLDGKIASAPSIAIKTRAGVPAAGQFTGEWITSEDARDHVQELRHQHDALLVGIGTILADDPLLTDRTGKPRRRPLLRIVLDSQLRLPLNSRLVRSAEDPAQKDSVLILYSAADAKKKSALEERGIRVEKLTAGKDDHRPTWKAILRFLNRLKMTSLMIEGGSTVNGSALAAGIVDKLFLYYAPHIMGGNGSVPFASGPAAEKIKVAMRTSSPRVHRFGEDFALEGYLRDPYAVATSK